MATAYSRVTVLSGTRRVDLALPTALPVSEVVPQLLRFCAPEERPSRPAAWSLGRVGGADISLAHSLAEAGVLDGDVLELRSAETVARPAYVEDVRDAVEDMADSAGGQWRTRTTLTFVLLLAAAAAALTPLLSYVRQPGDSGAVLAATLLAALAITGAWWANLPGGSPSLPGAAEPRAHPAASAALIAVGCLWAAIAAWLVAAWLGWPQPAVIVAATAGGLAAAIAARTVTTLAIPHLAT